MKKTLLALMFVLGFSGIASAQSATPANKLAWDQPNSTQAEAQSFTYKYYADGATTGVALTGVACVAGPPVSCSVAFPAFTPGSHTLQLTATNAAGESAKSVVFNFTFVVVPTAPGNIHIE